MRCAWLFAFATLLFTGCGRESARAFSAERLGCTASAVVSAVTKPEVTLVTDTSRLMPSWRAKVGPPLVDRTGRLCDDAPVDSLLVVSWNIHLGHAQLKRFITDLRAGRVVPDVPVRQFVILVQEAHREDASIPQSTGKSGCAPRMGGDAADIATLADSLGLSLFYVPSMRNGCDDGARQDRGNAILSTFPLTNLKAVELPLVRQRRVAALADVSGKTTSGETWTISLASVHLENRGSGTPARWVQGRAGQARALVAALPEADLAVVGGDFNTLKGPAEPAVKIVGAHFKNSAPHQSENTFTSYVVMRSHLDYLFFRCAGDHRSTYWRARERYGSDHYPIMGFVRVRHS
jgi:endonuclease/exonuclease/phosphatase family metal-dependent hydrolase